MMQIGQIYATSGKTLHRYTRFCGIDIAKRKHVACIIDQDGAFVARSQAFNNDAEGYQRILARLKEAGGPKRVIIAMEATGHYWYSLHDFMVDHGWLRGSGAQPDPNGSASQEGHP